MPDRNALSARINRAFAAHRPEGRAQMDEDANFFEAGFTSSRLSEVLVSLREDGIPLNLIDVFRYPTLRALTAEAAQRTEGNRPSAAPSLPWRTGPGA